MRAWIFRQLFSNMLPFKLINGKKTEIARALMFGFGVLAIGQEFYPEYLGLLGDVDAIKGLVFSYLGLEVAKAHREDKDKENG